MVDENRRRFLSITAKTAATGAVFAALPACVQKALEVPAGKRTGTIQDVKHVVILMQENRSFGHDRHPSESNRFLVGLQLRSRALRAGRKLRR
jgi:hypothetical protein